MKFKTINWNVNRLKKQEKDYNSKRRETNGKQGRSSEKELEKLFADPINVDALESVLNILNELDDKRLWSIFEEVMISLLRLKPLEVKVRKTILLCSQKITTNKSILLTHQAVSQRSEIIATCSLALYEAALEILEEHPDQIPLKSYALDVGRWRYSLNRPDGKVTVYDEQAIQNDIQVRSR